MKVAIVYNKKQIDESDVINIFGMVTKEHYSFKTVEKVAKSLEKGGHSVKIIEGGMNFIEDMKDFMPRVVAGERPGMVFNMAYGIQGQNRYTHVPAMLEMLGIPYVGSGPEAHAVVQDKVMTKLILQKNNIPTPGFWVFSSSQDTFDDLTFPVIVKPKMESTSMGMEVVYNWTDLRTAVKKQMEKYSQEILVEQFIAGREFAIGLLGNGTNIEVLPIVEMNLGDPNKIQTITDKKKTPVDKICPANLSKEQTEYLQNICILAFKKLGINDFTRVDLRMSKEGIAYILELNSLASLGQTGSFYTSAKSAGYTYDSLINKIFDTAAIRYFGESYLHPEHDNSDKIKSHPLRSIIRSYLRTHQTSNEKLLEHFVNINSSVYNLEDVNKLGVLVSKRLKHMGFHIQQYSEFDVGSMIYCTNHNSSENDILIVSHLDTWYSNQDFAPYHKIGNKIYGSGVAESKGGLIVMLSALQALRYARKLRTIKCGILLISDDSLGGRFSKKLVHDTAKISRYVLDMKSGLEENGLATSCSGITKYHIDMTHIRRANETNKDVIPEMCKKVSAWKKISNKHNNARISISSFKANTSFGQSPDYGTISLTSRYITKSQGDEFDKELHKIAKKSDQTKLDIHITKQVTRNPVEVSKETMQFYDIIYDIANKADIKISSKHRYASSSLGDIDPCVPMIGSMGPVGIDVRTPNEHIYTNSMIDKSTLLALVLNRLSEKYEA